MATIKIGINGFGRIGRMVFRAACTQTDKYEIVGINDLCPVDYLAYMLKYDTMHGQFKGTIDYNVEKSQLIVNGHAIRVTAEKDPANLKWNEVEAEYVAEPRVCSSPRRRLRLTSQPAPSMSSCRLPRRTLRRCSYAA